MLEETLCASFCVGLRFHSGCPWVGLLCHRVTMFNHLRNWLFSNMAAPFYIPISNGWRFWSFLILASTCYCRYISRCELYFIMVLIRIFPSGALYEHLLMHLVNLCILSLRKCLFKSLLHFSIELFIFIIEL
jgi:hypothetical protein